MKFVKVKLIDMYELNVLCIAVPTKRDRKYGVAVINAADFSIQKEKKFRSIHAPFHGSSTAQPKIKCIHRIRLSRGVPVIGTVLVGSVSSSIAAIDSLCDTTLSLC